MLATTRNLARADVLRGVGVDRVILDEGAVAAGGAYSGDAADLPPAVLQDFLDDVAARAAVPIARTYRLDEIVEAHTLMEYGSAGGKLVVVP